MPSDSSSDIGVLNLKEFDPSGSNEILRTEKALHLSVQIGVRALGLPGKLWRPNS